MSPEDRAPLRRAKRSESDVRRELIEAAQALLGTRPAGKLTARDVAARADCDPALVNYYFGGKDGLMSSALEDALQQLIELLEGVTRREGDVTDQVRRLSHDAIWAFAEKPFLPRLVIGQILLEDGPETDRFLAALGAPYILAVQALVEDGVRDGVFRRYDVRSLAYSFAAIPLFFFLMAPVLRRVIGDKAVSSDAVEVFARTVTELILNGLMVRDQPVVGEPPPEAG
jgi:AcrR family transcriptional regulator